MIGLAEVFVVSVIVLLIWMSSRRGGRSSARIPLDFPKRGTLSGKTLLVVIIAGVVTGVIARLTGGWMGVVEASVVESAVVGGIAGALGGFVVYRDSKRS